jgi:hypothetical protein
MVRLLSLVKEWSSNRLALLGRMISPLTDEDNLSPVRPLFFSSCQKEYFFESIITNCLLKTGIWGASGFLFGGEAFTLWLEFLIRNSPFLMWTFFLSYLLIWSIETVFLCFDLSIVTDYYLFWWIAGAGDCDLFFRFWAIRVGFKRNFATYLTWETPLMVGAFSVG